MSSAIFTDSASNEGRRVERYSCFDVFAMIGTVLELTSGPGTSPTRTSCRCHVFDPFAPHNGFTGLGSV